MYTKFSKTFSSLFELKKSFFINNTKLIKENSKLVALLKKQPNRIKCKNCNNKLKKKIDFISHGLNYKICVKCTHLNSEKDDNKKFHNFYRKNSSYSGFYKTNFKEYNNRVKNIYSPKLMFILEYFKKKKINILDVGTGVGHFLKACENNKIKAKGLEINQKMVDFGDKFLKQNKIQKVETFEESKEIILKNRTSNVLSLIGVLEHLEKPNQIFEIFNKSRIKYMFISIPLFNMSVFIDILFQKIYPRQLPATHPHLYTYRSINHLINKNNLKICGEWWFGTEVFDLYKVLKMNLIKNKKNSEKLINIYDGIFRSEMDNLQNIFDKKKKSSEVHLIIKKK